MGQKINSPFQEKFRRGRSTPKNVKLWNLVAHFVKNQITSWTYALHKRSSSYHAWRCVAHSITAHSCPGLNQSVKLVHTWLSGSGISPEIPGKVMDMDFHPTGLSLHTCSTASCLSKAPNLNEPERTWTTNSKISKHEHNQHLLERKNPAGRESRPKGLS